MYGLIIAGVVYYGLILFIAWLVACAFSKKD